MINSINFDSYSNIKKCETAKHTWVNSIQFCQQVTHKISKNQHNFHAHDSIPYNSPASKPTLNSKSFPSSQKDMTSILPTYTHLPWKNHIRKWAINYVRIECSACTRRSGEGQSARRGARGSFPPRPRLSLHSPLTQLQRTVLIFY